MLARFTNTPARPMRNSHFRKMPYLRSLTRRTPTGFWSASMPIMALFHRITSSWATPRTTRRPSRPHLLLLCRRGLSRYLSRYPRNRRVLSTLLRQWLRLGLLPHWQVSCRADRLCLKLLRPRLLLLLLNRPARHPNTTTITMLLMTSLLRDHQHFQVDRASLPSPLIIDTKLLQWKAHLQQTICGPPGVSICTM